MAESEQPPIWVENVPLAYGEYEVDGHIMRRGTTLWVHAQAWRTLRMDVVVGCRVDEFNDAQGDIFEELCRLAAGVIDWGKDIHLEARTDYDVGDAHENYQRLIVRVKSGHDLEPVINMIDRFKKEHE